MMDDLINTTTALGKGIYSVGEDIVYGLERTGEGLGIAGSQRLVNIGIENEYLATLLQKLFRFGVSTPQSPLFKIILKILIRYYAVFPEESLKKIAKQAAVGGGYLAGRMILGKELAKFVAKTIAVKIAASVAYKKLAKKVGVSAAAGSTGIGIPVSLLMFQGVAQRSAKASRRLRTLSPELYWDLRRENGLDMLYFLVEKPMEKHLQAIVTAKRNTVQFEAQVRKVYEQNVR